MKRALVVVMGLCASMLAACVLDSNEADTGLGSEPIVRGKVEKKLPQVVAIHVNVFGGGRLLCSGTYYAPRVVATAAHCRRFDAIPGQSFVYFGNDYLTDVATLPAIPPPGQPSVWARIETFTVHPLYDPAVNYPDIAVAHLDRELPFAPIPLLRETLPSSTKKGDIVGWGGSKALTADISQVEGVGIKRSAKVKILGSPTEADFHADDPNPGILVPEIRADLLKTDGEAPHANTCAGDSGGPLLVKNRGKDSVAGVGFWTGLFCEDYAIFTRIDPFLAFFDDAATRAGGLPVTPRLECVEPMPDGAFQAHFGYVNQNAVTVTVPYGPRNDFPADTANRRPTNFGPGDHPFEFAVGFAPDQRLTWTLSPPAGPTTVVVADASSPVCDPDDQTFLCAKQCDASFAAECFDGMASRAQCVSDCLANADFFAEFGCRSEWNVYLACVATIPPAAENWDCSFPGFPPFPAPPNCEPELLAAFACAGY